MNIGSICTRHIVSLDANQPLQRAAQLMREHHVGAVIVTRESAEGAHVGGIVTDRDLAIEVLARGGDASTVPVGRLLQGQGAPMGIAAGADVAQAVQAMSAAGVRRLLVHDAEGHLVGLVSIDDLLPALVQPLAGLADVLRSGLQHEAARRGALATAARPVLRVPALGTAGWQSGNPG